MARRIRIETAVLALARTGVLPPQIAARVGIKADKVRTLIAAAEAARCAAQARRPA